MKKKIIFILLILIYIFYNCKTDKEVINTKWFEGHWTGSAYQQDVDMSWTIDLTIKIEEKIFKIDYPSINCGGYWEIIDFNDEKAFFLERITYGLCIDYIDVELIKVDNNNIDVFFYYKSKFKAKGKLKKIK